MLVATHKHPRSPTRAPAEGAADDGVVVAGAGVPLPEGAITDAQNAQAAPLGGATLVCCVPPSIATGVSGLCESRFADRAHSSASRLTRPNESRAI